MDKLEEYFKGDALAASVWKSKYAVEGEKTPADMHRRMAKEFARIEFKNFKTLKTDGVSNHSTFGSNLNNDWKQKTVEELEEIIFGYFDNFGKIVPQGSIMAMLGNKYKIGSLSNCFVIGQPHDSYGGIMQKDQELVQLMKRRGGVGIDISSLRPSSTHVSNSAGTSTGAISFMHRYSNSTREVAQNGRRGALMITIDCRHPDVLDFINIKKDLTQVTGANISVQLRDDFMQAVKNNEDYILRFPCEFNNVEYMDGLTRKNGIGFDEIKYPKDYNTLHSVTDDDTGKTINFRRVKAKEYFDTLVENNWLSAEPGAMFVDRHWNYSPDGVYEQYRGVTTNPCGEIFMQMYDACRLLALNYMSVVENAFQSNSTIQWNVLYEIAYIQQRLADDLVDLEIEHIDRILEKIESDDEPEQVKQTERELWKNIKRVASSGRRTGCGFTALGDMIASLNLKYDSKEAKEIIANVSRIKLEAELDCSIDLSIERGSFEGWSPTLEFDYSLMTKSKQYINGKNEFYQMIAEEFPKQAERMIWFGRRNVCWNTVAPTGTVSLLTQTTSGLEPLFAAFYFRNKKVVSGMEGVRVDYTDQNGDSWMEYPVLHPKFKEWINLRADLLQNIDDNPDVSVEELKKSQIEYLFEESPWYKSCANDIDWIERVEIQGIIQRYTTHSISSTINLPNDVSKEKISEIYMRAWESGLKGVTVYRDGCRSGVLVTESNKKTEVTFEYHDAPKRPEELPCDVYTAIAKGIKWNVIVGMYENKPYEVFAIPHFTNKENLLLKKMKKGRYDLFTVNGEIYFENVTSQMSDEENVLTRMISTALRHGSQIKFIVEQLNKSHGSIVSFSKVIARVLSKYDKASPKDVKEKCPECNEESLRKEEGCTKCTNPECGYSRC